MDDTSPVCSVCLETVSSADICELPGCGHTFHCSCALNFIQYDQRCPVCRQLPTGVQPRSSIEGVPHEQTAQEAAPDQELYDFRLRWRRYTDRRRRFLQQRPHIHKAYLHLKKLRQAMNAELHKAQRAYDDKCKEIWRHDEVVCEHKRKYGLMRRRERRLETLIHNAIRDLGPEPFSHAFGTLDGGESSEQEEQGPRVFFV